MGRFSIYGIYFYQDYIPNGIKMCRQAQNLGRNKNKKILVSPVGTEQQHVSEQ